MCILPTHTHTKKKSYSKVLTMKESEKQYLERKIIQVMKSMKQITATGKQMYRKTDMQTQTNRHPQQIFKHFFQGINIAISIGMYMQLTVKCQTQHKRLVQDIRHIRKCFNALQIYLCNVMTCFLKNILRASVLQFYVCSFPKCSIALEIHMILHVNIHDDETYTKM